MKTQILTIATALLIAGMVAGRAEPPLDAHATTTTALRCFNQVKIDYKAINHDFLTRMAAIDRARLSDVDEAGLVAILTEDEDALKAYFVAINALTDNFKACK